MCSLSTDVFISVLERAFFIHMMFESCFWNSLTFSVCLWLTCHSKVQEYWTGWIFQCSSLACHLSVFFTREDHQWLKYWYPCRKLKHEMNAVVDAVMCHLDPLIKNGSIHSPAAGSVGCWCPTAEQVLKFWSPLRGLLKVMLLSLGQPLANDWSSRATYRFFNFRHLWRTLCKSVFPVGST